MGLDCMFFAGWFRMAFWVGCISPVFFVVCGIPVVLAMPEASFSCEGAATPVEHLVCNDPVLLELDGKLDPVALEKRVLKLFPVGMPVEDAEWRRHRLQVCGIPDHGAMPSERDRWSMSPCLVRLYRDRLAVVRGVQDETLPSAATDLSPGVVHPLCVSALVADRGVGRVLPLSVADCNRGYSHVDVQPQDGGWFSADSAVDGVMAWTAWSDAGILPDGRRVKAVNENGGGTGAFGSVWAFEHGQAGDGADSVVGAQILYTGGDRCNGGVDSAVVKGTDVVVSVNLTPAGLIQIVDNNQAISGDLPDCAACCIGMAHYRIHPGANRDAPGPEGVSLGPDAGRDFGSSVQETCFVDRVVKVFSDNGGELVRPDLERAVRSFVSCVRMQDEQHRR